jgi:hypothetical protein
LAILSLGLLGLVSCATTGSCCSKCGKGCEEKSECETECAEGECTEGCSA